MADEATKPPTELVKDIVIIFLAGIAIVLGVLMLVYFLSVIMDRCCFCCPGFTRPGETRDIDHGPVARKAGLWGLRQDERQQILERLLTSKPYSHDMIKSQSKGDVENPVPSVSQGRIAVEDSALEQGYAAGVEETKESSSTPSEESSTADDAEKPSDGVEYYFTCAICLSDYVQGDTVVSGTSCSHLFHKTCAFEWLQKHDHCPYCRKEMMTPNEMLATANEILGESRVLEMRMWGPTEELRRNEFDSAAVNSTPTVEMTSVESS